MGAVVEQKCSKMSQGLSFPRKGDPQTPADTHPNVKDISPDKELAFSWSRGERDQDNPSQLPWQSRFSTTSTCSGTAHRREEPKQWPPAVSSQGPNDQPEEWSPGLHTARLYKPLSPSLLPRLLWLIPSSFSSRGCDSGPRGNPSRCLFMRVFISAHTKAASAPRKQATGGLRRGSGGLMSFTYWIKVSML